MSNETLLSATAFISLIKKYIDNNLMVHTTSSVLACLGSFYLYQPVEKTCQMLNCILNLDATQISLFRLECDHEKFVMNFSVYSCSKQELPTKKN